MRTRSTTSIKAPVARALASAMAVVWSVLSLLSFLAVFGPSPIATLASSATARCDASERPAALDRRIEPARVHAVRPARGSEVSAPRVRVTPFPATIAVVVAGRPDALAEQQRAARPFAIDASIPRARLRAERMVFLI